MPANFLFNMHIPRVYYPIELKPGSVVTLDQHSSNHLLKVLRLHCGENLILFNGNNLEFTATLTTITKQQATVTINSSNIRNSESPLQIHLGQGISRGEKMDFTIQKAVELGVHAITPLFTEFCNVKLQAERLENRLRHWNGIIVNACEQSGRCYLPQLNHAVKLETWLPAQAELCFVLDPTGITTLDAVQSTPKKITLLVGPEGGLSESELTLAKKHGFIPLKLGPRILRTETAALVAISVLQAKWGDLR